MSSFGYLIKEGFKNIFNNRMMSLASIGVLISCLVLTGSAVMLTINVSNIVDSVSGKNATKVYLDDDVDKHIAIQIGELIKEVDHVEEVELIDKEDAIKNFKGQLGNEIFENMTGDGNPLPYSFSVTVDNETMQDVAQYDATMDTIKKIKFVDNYGEVRGGVHSVSSHRDVAKKLTSLSSLIAMMSFWIILALAVISLFIIANTIRMTMFSHRFEISIMKSVGATNTFVRIPFVIEGIFIGLVSAVFSVVILYFLSGAVIGAVKNILPFEYTPFTDVMWYITGAFAGAGVLVGILGSLMSISRFLRREGNEILGW